MGIVGCSNGGKVFDSSKGRVGDSGPGTGGAADPSGNGGAGNPTGNGGTQSGTGGDSTPGAGGNGGTFVGEQCNGACCPTDPRCYSTPAGNGSPGSECLATQDNTGKEHIQLRQQWIRATTPAGNATGLVYSVLAGRSQLPWKACNQTGGIGSGGYIELIDLFLGGADISEHYATLGYAQFAQGPASPGDPGFTPPVVDEGFCYGTEDYAGDPAYRLPTNMVGDGAGFPAGLPHPMSLVQGPWRVRPTKAKRVAANFNLTDGATRTELLAKLDPNGEYGQAGFGGVFFYDDVTGTMHAFASLSWAVIYDATGATHLSIPMREVETTTRFNRPSEPNCIGEYRPAALDPTTCNAGQDPTNPGWGGGDCTATTGSAGCRPGESAASTKGYFLISELEQIYASELQETLCVSYPGIDPASAQPLVSVQGFYDPPTKRCLTANWNPSDSVNGLPMGDWCAKTNAPATADCHDAWRGISFHAFSGAKIKLTTSGSPTTCAF